MWRHWTWKERRAVRGTRENLWGSVFVAEFRVFLQMEIPERLSSFEVVWGGFASFMLHFPLQNVLISVVNSYLLSKTTTPSGYMFLPRSTDRVSSGWMIVPHKLCPWLLFDCRTFFAPIWNCVSSIWTIKSGQNWVKSIWSGWRICSKIHSSVETTSAFRDMYAQMCPDRIWYVSNIRELGSH